MGQIVVMKRELSLKVKLLIYWSIYILMIMNFGTDRKNGISYTSRAAWLPLKECMICPVIFMSQRAS